MFKEQVHAPPDNASYVWLPGIVARIARFVSVNEIACTFRLVDKTTSLQALLQLSRPSPAHAFKRRWGSPIAFRVLSRKQRLKVLCFTAASGCLENLQIALDNAGLAPDGELLEAAAGAGQLVACKLLRERGCVRRKAPALVAAAKGGLRHMCEWLLANGSPLTSEAVYAAACGGHEGLMYWLLQLLREDDGIPGAPSWLLLRAAAEGLDLGALQRLYPQGLPAGQQQEQPVLNQALQAEILAAAAASPTPDWQAKVEWLEGLGYPRTEVASERAAARAPCGDAVGRLRWLHARGYPMGTRAVNKAGGEGDMDALRFLVEQAGVRPSTGPERAHLAALQYLHARGFDLKGVASLAAEKGNLLVVAWAVEALGVNPGNAPDLLDSAAKAGSVELMAWLRERGWGWGKPAMTFAVHGGCEEALEWLVERGCPWQVDGFLWHGAACTGDLAMLRCLHRLGCHWTQRSLGICIYFEMPVPALRLLVELGCWEPDWGQVAAEVEAQRPSDYHAAVLEWLGEEQRRRQAAGA